MHLSRKNEIDKKVLADLIIGVGALFNFCNSKELGKDNDLPTHPTKSVAGLTKTPTIFDGLSFQFTTFAIWNINRHKHV